MDMIRQVMKSNPSSEQVIFSTQSLCPVCFARIPAYRVVRGDDICLEKQCERHGGFSTVVWRGVASYRSWVAQCSPLAEDNVTAFSETRKGCPFDCGLCPQHRRSPCCVLLEVTGRCDLNCPLCFADAGGDPCPDPDLSTIKGWYQRLLSAGGPFNIQLSGGEPCLRDDLPRIITTGKSLGFDFFQVNTNGIRLASDRDYLCRLADAGLVTVYLQFDGTTDDIHIKLRGRALLAHKKRVIAHCAEHRIGVVLVPTLVAGVNTDDVGNIIGYAKSCSPTVRGVHFQPVSYFGRYPEYPGNRNRITLPEVIRLIVDQCDGMFMADQFKPPCSEHILCSFHGNFVLMPDGSFFPLTRRSGSDGCCGKGAAARAQAFVSRSWAYPEIEASCRQSGSSRSLGQWDSIIERAKTHQFSISAMAFQDIWNIDLDRLKQCHIITVSRDGRLVPFCANNLTNTDRQALYR